jgi:hypothetical protein
MRPAAYGWTPLAGRDDLLWLKYWWGPGSANALAFRQTDGDWAIVSPPSDAPAAVFDDLAARGRVASLIAPNGFHYLGQAAWRARFAGAQSFAPAGALPRLAAKAPGVDFHRLEDHFARFAPAQILVPGGMKTPDAMISLPVDGGWLWWLGDQYANVGKADASLPLRLLSRILTGGPGYHCNCRPEMVYVEDRAVWARDLAQGLRQRPPRLVLCAHGAPVTSDAEQRTLACLRQVAGAV